MSSSVKETGQALILAALLMTVISGFAAIAIDVGMVFSERARLQSAVDASALAGVQLLPDNPAAAEAAGQQWAANNGITSSDQLQVTISTTLASNDTTTVVTKRHLPAMFSRVLGFFGFDVQTKAVARVGSPAGLRYFMPFAVLNSSLQGLQTGDPATIKYNSQDASKGNSLLLDPGSNNNCGGGANALYCNIFDGSQWAYCAYGQEYPGCPSTVPTKTGQDFGKVQQALKDRITQTSTNCDTFGEVFVPDPASSSDVLLTNQCNPYPPYNVTDSKRVIILPVIDQLPSGTSNPVTIVRFSLFFLDSLTCSQGQGSCSLNGTYIQNVGNFFGYEQVGAYFPTAPFIIRKLIE